MLKVSNCSSVRIGLRAEDAAIEFLQRQNVLILHRNFRCRFGEIDLIAKDDQHLVFAEVRYRKNTKYGTASETVTVTKQRKIIHAAEFYLRTRAWAHKVKCRFDVIAMSQTIDSPHIDWIKDAFNGEIS
jgi:putative endonuclease